VRTLAASRVLTPTGFVEDSVVSVDDAGVIVSIERATGNVADRVLAPGFVDLQVNGIDDIDCATVDGGDWDRLDALLAAQGVTTWCPTLVTMPLPRYAAPLDRIGAAMRRPAQSRPTIAGVHLEGPFLGGAPGAHRRELIVPIDLDWLAALPTHLSMMTLGAEQPDAVAAIAVLRAKGVLVSLGHTMAGHEQVIRALDAGAAMVTHLFNGMSGLHHRDPGVVASVLTHASAAASMIADGVHVHPRMLLLAASMLGSDRTVLVTDSVAWRRGSVGPITLSLKDGAPRLPDGTLAGSIVTMDAAIRKCVGAGIALDHVLRAASTNPARLLGRSDRGAIAVGHRADLVALTPALDIEQTFIAGKPTLIG
jgi:N-acetylglucosamine-6-phosphate deacetylase